MEKKEENQKESEEKSDEIQESKIGDMVWEDEWMQFILKEKKDKTNVYSVVSKSSDTELGEVKWFPSWRHYCFFPTIEDETVYSDRCLINLGNFVSALNENHKHQNKQNPTPKELEEIERKVHKIAYDENMRMTKWLYDAHKDILREYEKKFHGGLQIHYV